MERDNVSEPLTQLSGTTLSFTEVKTCQKFNSNNFPGPTVFEKETVYDPLSKTHITFIESLCKKIIDINALKYVDLETKLEYDLQTAVLKNNIKSSFFDSINKYYGISDPKDKTKVTLLEAIQKKLLNPKLGHFMNAETGNDVCLEAAVSFGIIEEEQIIKLIENNIVRCCQYSIPEAVLKGLLDSDSGVFTSPFSHIKMSIHQAYRLGYLYSSPPIIEDSLSLSEALDYGCIDRQGKVTDPDSGKLYNISNALNHGVLSKRFPEVVNLRVGNIVTLPVAVEHNLINCESGCYVHPLNGKEISLKQAQLQRLILPSMTLKSAYEKSLIQENGVVVNIINSNKVSFLRATVIGLLNLDIKCIISPVDDRLLTLAEALLLGIVTSDCKFFDWKSNEFLTISQAANRGYLATVDKRMIFEIEGFKDTSTNEYVSFNTAVSRGIVNPKTGYVQDLNTGLKRRISRAVECKLVIPQVYEILSKTIGVYKNGKELTLLDAVSEGYLDCMSGSLIDPQTKLPIRLVEAVEKDIITEEGAVTLKSLLTITVTLTSITKTTTRYVTIANQNFATDLRMTFDEAFSCGLIDEMKGTFRDPITESVMPVEEAYSKGYLSLLPSSGALIKQSEMTVFKNGTKAGTDYSAGLEFFSSKKDLFDPETCETEQFVNEITIDNFAKATIDQISNLKNSVNLGFKNMPLKRAVDAGMLNAKTGYWRTRGSEETITFEESINRGYLDPKSAVVFVCNSQIPLYLNEAIVCNMLSSTGHYLMSDKKMTLDKALKLDFVKYSDEIVKHFCPIDSDSKWVIDSSILCNKISSNTQVEAVDMGIEPVNLRKDVCERSTETEENSIINQCQADSGVKYDTFDNLPDSLVFPMYETHNAVAETVVTIQPEPQSGAKIDSDPNVDEEQKQDELEDRQKVTKKQYSEPKFEVTIGTAQSMKSPAKAVVLKKVKRKKVPANYAAQKGITDQKTADTLKDIENLLGPTGQPLSLEEALRLSIIDGNKGVIINPQNNETLNISQALDKGLLDPESGSFMLPIGRSLTIPEAVKQGLIEPVKQKIVHPEHGEHLSIQEAIICEIIDPLSELTEPASGMNLTLESAIDTGVIDGDQGEVQTCEGTISMLEAVQRNMFEPLSPNQSSLPPLAATFPVALHQNFISIQKRSYIHPINKKCIPILKAIEQGFILSTYEQPHENSIHLWTALERNLIQQDSCTLIHPGCKEVISIEAAVDSGLLLITSEIPYDPVSEIGIKSTDVSPTEITSLQVYILSDLLRCNLVNRNECSVTLRNGKQTLLASALNESLFSDSLVEIVGTNEIVVLIKSVKEVNKRSIFNLDVCLTGAFYDPVQNTFLNATANSVSFESFLGDHVSDLSLCRVKNQKNLTFVPVREAFFISLIDRDTGTMFDLESGMNISCFDAASKCLIAIMSKAIILDEKSISPMTLKEAIEKGIFHLNAAEVQLPECLESLPLCEALIRGVIIASSVMVYNIQKDSLVSVPEACQINLVDINRDMYIHPVTSQELSLQEAFKRGLIVPKQHGMSLEAAMNLGLVDCNNGLIVDPVTKSQNNIEASVRRGVIDASLTLVKDTEKSVFLSLEEGIQNRLVLKSGKIKNMLTRDLLSFDEALREGLIKTAELHMPLVQALNQFYDTHSGQLFNPLVGCNVTLRQAIEMRFVDSESARVKHFRDGHLCSIQESFASQILNPDRGVYNAHKPISLREAVDRALVINCQVPLTLSEALENNFYVADKGLFKILSDNEKSLHQLIQEKVIIENIQTVFKASSFENLSLREAIEENIINPHVGLMTHPISNKELSLYEAYDVGLILPIQRKLTFAEAISSAFYSESAVAYFDPLSRKNLPLREAVSSNYIDITETLFCNIQNQELLLFSEAVEQDVVDLFNGNVFLESSRESISIKEAAERELIVDSASFSLGESFRAGIYQRDTGLFLNPFTKSKCSLAEAISNHLIKSDSITVKDVRNDGHRGKLPLIEAIEKNLVDSKRSLFHISSDVSISIDEAFELGYICEDTSCISLQKAICDKLCDSDTGRITFPDGHCLTLRDSLKRKRLNGSVPCLWDENCQRLVSLNESIKKGVINSSLGLFSDPENTNIPLVTALQKGLILDTEKSFTLYEILKFNLFTKGGKMINPRNGMLITLKTACTQGIISPHLSLIKMSHNKIITLGKAIQENIINSISGTYNLSPTESISLREAYNLELIIPFCKPCSFEQYMQMSLYNKDTGCFVDPISGRKLSLQEAIMDGLIQDDNVGLIVENCKTLKTLKLAIEDGTIDSTNGKLMLADGHTKVPLDEALQRQLIVMVEEGFFEYFESHFALDSSFVLECTLAEAIEKNIVDPETSFIKDASNSSLITVKEGVAKKVINLQKKVVLSHISKQNVSLVIRYNDNKLLYKSKPVTLLQAIEQKQLNVLSGMFMPANYKEILSLKGAIDLGYIDPNSAIVKDVKECMFCDLGTSFTKGTLDPNRCVVLNTANNQILTLKGALNSGLLLTLPHSFSLTEVLSSNMYDLKTFMVRNPFSGTSETLGQSLSSGLICATSTLIKDPATGEFFSINDAVKRCILCTQSGCLMNLSNGDSTSLRDAYEQRLLVSSNERVRCHSCRDWAQIKLLGLPLLHAQCMGNYVYLSIIISVSILYHFFLSHSL